MTKYLLPGDKVIRAINDRTSLNVDVDDDGSNIFIPRLVWSKKKMIIDFIKALITFSLGNLHITLI
jgi:hypothetical protein